MIVLFCGIPGSGKTTAAELLARRLAEKGRVRLISSDKLRTPVYRKMFKEVTADRSGRDFLILDATFYKKEWRCQVKTLAGDERAVTVYLFCPLEVALRRNKSRQPNISEKALHIMFHRMQPPEHPTVFVDTSVTSPAQAAERVIPHASRSG